MIAWFRQLSELQRGLLVWGLVLAGAFLPVELAGHFLHPWPTLSRTVWDSIRWWHPVAGMVAVFLFVLWGHLDRDWSVGYLVVVAALIMVAVVTHAVAP